MKDNMIAVDHALLSDDALENLIIDIITRQNTDYSEHEIDIGIKKKQLKQKLLEGKAVIIYDSEEDSCNIIRMEDYISFGTS